MSVKFLIRTVFTFTLLGVALLSATASSALAKPVAPITLAECEHLSPVTMAEQSEAVMNSYQYLQKTVDEISNPALRSMVSDYLKQPVPRLLERFASSQTTEQVLNELVAAGYVKSDATSAQFLPPAPKTGKIPQPFYSAPGSGYGSHHSYPGGLVTHVAANTKIATSIYNAYKDIYGMNLQRDTVIAAQILHDLHKPWVFQWQENKSSLPENTIAGTGAHHILSIAEALYRGLPSEVVVALACAHTPPSGPADEQQIVAWLKAAAIIAGKDPVTSGLLAPSGDTLPLPRKIEGFITHLGDHDYVLTVPAAQWLIAQLETIACTDYTMTEAELHTAKFHSFRNYIFSQITAEKLYNIWTTGGDNELRKTIHTLIRQ